MGEPLVATPVRGSVRQDTESRRLLARAAQSVAKGASSSMRVLDYHLPLVIDRGEGAVVWDVDGNDLIDMNMGYGPLIFGHRPRIVIEAIERELHHRGTLLGFPDTLSIEVAELVKASFPSIDLLRFTSTGTEASQTAVRLARAFTGRPKLILFEGAYHGSTDGTFHKYHAAPADLDARNSKEVIPGTGGMNGGPRDIVLVPYNDLDALAAALAANRGQVAAVMLEPVLGNAGTIAPDPGFLQSLASMARADGALVIFDEVISGFRVARGGAQERYGVAADLTMLSKAISGGVPLGAIGGRAEIMKLMVDGKVFHGGVFSGNPMCLAAALAVQREYERNGPAIYGQLEDSSTALVEGIRGLFAEAGVPAIATNVGAMISVWIGKTDAVDVPRSYRDVVRMMDHEKLIRLQHASQRIGLYFHPNHFEPWYMSTAHSPAIIATALERLRDAIKVVDWRSSR